MALVVLGFWAMTNSLGFAAETATQTARTNTLDRYRTTYEATTAKITSETQQLKAEALVQYGKLLDSAMTILKQKGDIDAFGVVSAEAKRFATDKTVLTNATNPYISSAVTRFQKQLIEADTEQTRRQTALLKQYIGALSGLVRDLMAKDKIDDAKEAGEIRKAAEVLLADIEKPATSVVPVNPVSLTPKQPAEAVPVEQILKTAVQEPSPTNEPSSEPVSVQDKTVATPQNQASRIMAKDKVGHQLRDVKHGETITISYVKGMWTPHSVYNPVMTSPDEKDGCPLKVFGRLEKDFVLLATVPIGTKETPFEYQFEDDYPEVRIGMGELFNYGFDVHDGFVVYTIMRGRSSVQNGGEPNTPGAKAVATGEPTPASATPKESSDRLAYGGHHYSFVDAHGHITYEKSVSECESLGGHLVTPNTRNEWEWIKRTFLEGNAEKKFRTIYLGIEMPEKGWWTAPETKWIDGQKFSAKTADWASGHPWDHKTATGYRFRWIMTFDGHWATVGSDDERINGFVCEWDTSTNSPPATAQHSSLGTVQTGNIVYLSDLPEASVSGCTSYGLVKGKLDTWTVNGKIPRKGILACAPSSVVYDISNLKMTTLEGSVGIGRVNVNSSVKFRIHGDDKLLWESDDLRQGSKQGVSPVVKFSVTVTGISRIELEVDPLGDINSDHSIWIDPRLTRQR